MVVRKRERERESKDQALNWRHQKLTSKKINYVESVLADI